MGFLFWGLVGCNVSLKMELSLLASVEEVRSGAKLGNTSHESVKLWASQPESVIRWGLD